MFLLLISNAMSVNTNVHTRYKRNGFSQPLNLRALCIRFGSMISNRTIITNAWSYFYECSGLSTRIEYASRLVDHMSYCRRDSYDRSQCNCRMTIVHKWMNHTGFVTTVAYCHFLLPPPMSKAHHKISRQLKTWEIDYASKMERVLSKTDHMHSFLSYYPATSRRWNKACTYSHLWWYHTTDLRSLR